MEKTTIDFIQSLPVSEEVRRTLIEMVEWEKEVSWSDGYATAEEQAPDTKHQKSHPSCMHVHIKSSTVWIGRRRS